MNSTDLMIREVYNEKGNSEMKLSNNLTIDNVYDSIVSRHPGIWGYDYEQKAFIRRVLEEGIDVKWYEDPSLDLFEMAKIHDRLLGVEEGTLLRQIFGSHKK